MNLADPNNGMGIAVLSTSSVQFLVRYVLLLGGNLITSYAVARLALDQSRMLVLQYQNIKETLLSLLVI